MLPSLLTQAAIAPLTDTAFLRVTGEDRLRWLNGMVTNAIPTLALHEGCYNFVLSAQGRIQADLTAFRRSADLLLQTHRDRIPALIALFDRFIIMDDVELTDESPLRTAIQILGPRAAEHLTPILAPHHLHPNTLPPLHLAESGPLTLIHAHSPPHPRFELWSTDPALLESLATALNLPQATPNDLESLRLLEGTPLFGADIRPDKDLPQETAQLRALSFNKGCYLGQEIVERIHSRGQVHRTLAAFRLEGSLPTPNTPISAATDTTKPLGELTSAARIDLPSGPIQLALGTIRRETLDLKIPLTYPGGRATPISVPYTQAIEP